MGKAGQFFRLLFLAQFLLQLLYLTVSYAEKDSTHILWEAVNEQKKRVEELIEEYESRLEKLRIQEEFNSEQIETLQKLEKKIAKDFSGGNVGMRFSGLFAGLIFVPFFVLLLFVLYLRFKQKKEMNQINDNLHSYLNESKKLITELAENLEKITDEAVEKAKGRIRILELLVAEAGQKIKPLNPQADEPLSSTASFFKKTKPKSNPPSAPLTQGNFISRYKNSSKLNAALPKMETKNEKDDKLGMIVLLKKKGFSTTEIAKKLNMGVGEVELILNLKKKRS